MSELKRRGHEVVFCASRDDYTSRLQAIGFRYIPIVLERKGTNIFKDMLLLFSLIKIYRRERPDWIFHNSVKPNIYGSVAAYFSGSRCINTVSGLGYLFIRKSFMGNFIRGLYKLADHHADKIFFQNKDDLQLFLDGGLADPGKCALVAGSGVNTDLFKPSENKDVSLSKEGFVFLYLGRILWDKGIGELIESVRILKKRYPLMKVDFLGMIDKGNPAGISRSQVKEWEEEGLIEYLGEAVDVRPYLERSDCVVLPSYREGLPKTLLEASAMELPVIATDVTGCREAVEDKITGLLVKAKDAHALADAMDKVINMTESQRREMGKNGRAKMVGEFSEKAVIKTYLSQIGLFNES